MGFQFIVDDSEAFSALAADFLENIADEYLNTPVLLYTVRSPSSYAKQRSQKQMITRNIHDAVSFSKLSSFCNLIVPAGLPILSRSKASSFLCIKDENPYHCNAIHAAAVHSISLPFRMEPLGPATDSCYVSGAMDVNGLVQTLAGQARQNMVCNACTSYARLSHHCWVICTRWPQRWRKWKICGSGIHDCSWCLWFGRDRASQCPKSLAQLMLPIVVLQLGHCSTIYQSLAVLFQYPCHFPQSLATLSAYRVSC